MTRRVRALSNGVGRALSGVRKNPATAIAVVTIVAVAFFLVGSLYTAGAAFDAGTRSFQRAHMVLYLEHDVAPERADEIRALMARLDGVIAAEYVAPERALARVRETLGPDDPALAGIEAGMLPASIEVTLDAGMGEVAALQPTVERLRAMDGVEDVDFAEHWVDDLSALRTGVRGAGVIAVFALLVLALYLATSVLAGRLAARANEAAVARLFGATPVYVHGPLVLEGTFLGALGAGLALIGLSLFLACVAPAATALFGGSAGHALALPQTGVLLSFVGAGALLGACSAWLAGGWGEGRRRADA
jgi:cell division transport system permease protein